MSPSRPVRVLAAAVLTLTPVLAAAGQSSVTVSPFVSYIPSAATNPLAGFALTFGGTTGLALRSGAEMSISTPALDSSVGQSGGYRPWGADADLMLFLGGLGGGATVFTRSLSPYAFAGIGLTGGDSAGFNVVRHGWSYGLGAAIPLGLHADIFGEARWRLSQYVLPTSQGAPDSKSAMRFGLSFHVGGGGGSNEPPRAAPRPRRRHRIESVEHQDDGVEYVVTPAPASPPVVVITPAPAPPPQVVVLEAQPAPEPVVIVTPEPAPAPTVVVAPRPSRSRPTIGASSARRAVVVVPAPTRTRPTARVYTRGATRSTQQPSASGSARRSTRPSAAAADTLPKVQARTQARTRTPVAASRTKRASAGRGGKSPQ